MEAYNKMIDSFNDMVIYRRKLADENPNNRDTLQKQNRQISDVFIKEIIKLQQPMKAIGIPCPEATPNSDGLILKITSRKEDWRFGPAK